ncbi:MAG: hypothetical protein RLZZ28_347 [Bacteroidota bacterium]|jgi:hypothetical protein
MKTVFSAETAAELTSRINRLTPETKQVWGKMSVAQMLAHCNVSYEMIYTDIHPKPNAMLRLVLQLLVKNKVVSEKPYTQSLRTAPQFIITSDKNFELEKQRLIDFVNQTQQLGALHFEGKESHSFGKLSSHEWNNMLYKHLDHHLKQFGV